VSNGSPYAPVGRCIYCGKPPTSDEHIIPLGLNGNLILPDASCNDCRDITKKFEQSCLRGLFGPLRARLNLKTRRPKERPKIFQTPSYYPGGPLRSINIPVEKLPLACVGFRFPPPGITRGDVPSDEWRDASQVVVRYAKDDPAFSAVFHKDGRRVRLARVDPLAFGRMLAKIAHAYVVANEGMDKFDPVLVPLILGTSNVLPYFIGGDSDLPFPPPSGETQLHDLRIGKCLIKGDPYLYVTIRLFAFMEMPRYLVIAGKTH
jgi:hypothetical protein